MRLRQLLNKPLSFAILVSLLLTATSVLALTPIYRESVPDIITVEPGVTFSDTPYTNLNISVQSNMTFSSISLTAAGISFSGIGLNITNGSVNITLIKWNTALASVSQEYPFIFSVVGTATITVFGLSSGTSYTLYRDGLLLTHYTPTTSIAFSASAHTYSLRTDPRPGEQLAAGIGGFIIFLLALLPILTSFMVVRGVLKIGSGTLNVPLREKFGRDKE